MQTLVFGIIAIGILLYILKFFEWNNFFKSLGVPRQIRRLRGANWYESLLFFLVKVFYAGLNGALQLFKFCFRCAWKMNLKIGGFKTK